MLYTVKTGDSGEFGKAVAAVNDAGEIHFYVPTNEIPGAVLLRIEHDADAMCENYEREHGG